MAGDLVQALCTLVAIAMVHADNRRACAITVTLFATGAALSVLLIAAYSRPFTGEISVTPELLKQVIATEAKEEYQPLVAASRYVPFGSLADILISPRHVRFTPNNGRWAAHPSQHLAVPSGWCSPYCRCFL